jgi:hypothetical protein
MAIVVAVRFVAVRVVEVSVVIVAEVSDAELCPYINASPAVVPAASPVILCEAIGMFPVIGV